MNVLVGFVTYSGHKYCRKQFFEHLKQLTYLNLECFIITNSGEKDAQELRKIVKDFPFPCTVQVDEVQSDYPFDIIVSGRNKIRDFFLAGDYDYLHMMDSDIISSKNRIEVFFQDAQRLGEKGKLLAGWYFGFEDREGLQHLMPMIWATTHDSPARRLTVQEMLEPRIFPFFIAGLGLTFIAREVLEKVSFRTDPKQIASEDTAFFTDCRKAGYVPLCDSRINGWHLVYPIGDKRNIPFNPQYHKKK